MGTCPWKSAAGGVCFSSEHVFIIVHTSKSAGAYCGKRILVAAFFAGKKDFAFFTPLLGVFSLF